jgi:hypothetical protein
MFDYTNDIPPLFSEIDEEGINSDNIYITRRKSSFIDLLSYNKSSNDPNVDDLCNLDALFDGSTSTELAEIKPENPTVLLMIDDFPDITFVSPTIHTLTSEKVHQKAQAKHITQPVGTLSVSERQKKIQRYLEKKKKRTWVKRIHYDCRKKVADNRLRIKGRFVTRNKAFDIINEGGNKLEAK